jgi:methyltransferase family protein
MNDVREERSRLLRLTDFAGIAFGTEDFCLFLYSLIRMNAQRNIVELGSGLGISAFWMALAAKRNGVGHVWTVDDHTLFERRTILDEMANFLRTEGDASADIITGAQYFERMASFLGLREFVSFVKGSIDLKENKHFDRYPFGAEPIDLLFSDFRHKPDDILSILGQFLPRMSPASSIFFDSAPAYWPSYLLLECLTAQLNDGHMPQELQARSAVDLRPCMLNRKIRLVHLTKPKEQEQNGSSWLKLEPVDVMPHPRTRMRGV